MRKSYWVALALFAGASAPAMADQDLPHHNLPVSADGNLVVGLCDGETSVEVPGVKPGEPMTREQAQWAADQLMAEWRKKHPDADWVVAAAETEGLMQPTKVAQNNQAQNSPVVTTGNPKTGGTAAQTQTYGAFTERDQKIWQDSTDALVAEGNKIFHDASLLGGTDAISCDMCHPNAANTHPETYPKYQVQLGRVALLRDMINWCIENPVRGKPLADDDPKMKALEAYILAQRKGTPLNYGKH
jgi:thiosulfate dehydrogenase